MTSFPRGPVTVNPELEALFECAKKAMESMTPTQRAIMFLRQKVSYVASEMTCDSNDNVVRTRAEADAIAANSDSALILAEIDRLTTQNQELIEALRGLLTIGEECERDDGQCYGECKTTRALLARIEGKTL